MQYTSAIALLASVAAALPAPQEAPEALCPYEPFGLIAIRSGSPLQYASASARRGNLILAGNNTDATCDTPQQFATFTLGDEGEAFLFTGAGETQQLYLDRSGMGQGKIGYVTGDAPSLPRYAETKGWAVEDGYFTFNGTGLQACPGSALGGYSLWLGDVTNPGYNEGCQGIALRVEKSDNPVACQYTSV